MQSERTTIAPPPLLWRVAAPAIVAWTACALLAWVCAPFWWAAVVTAASVAGGVFTLWWVHVCVRAPLWRVRDRARRLASVEAPTGMRGAGDEIRDIQSAMGVVGETLESQRRALDQARGSLESLIDALADAAFMSSYDGVVMHCNAAASAFFGESEDRVVGRPTRSLFTRADLLSLHSAGWRDGSRQVRCRLPTPRGERTYEVVVTPLPPTGVSAPASITVLRDVSELADTQRVKTDFVANASHELRTPLAAIRAGIETLHSARDDPRMTERVLQMIGGQVTRLEELVRDLLDLARVESPDLPVRPGPLRLQELIDSLRSEFEPVCAERSLTIDFALDEALDGVETDPRLCYLILRNLVENATKFCDERTTVGVVGALRRDGEGETRLRCEVRDRGMGIPLNQQHRVFERFYQVDQARSGGPPSSGAVRRGTGLGLAIVRHAVRAMGGSVGVESVWKHGTTVWFETPVPPRPAPAPADTDDPGVEDPTNDAGGPRR
ncbi:MAG: PAS domain-containing protein [Phycisphaerales bacterium]|nr:MAG: PAS domain-containing protein [Phycisphaerales bacterium]